MMDGIKNGGLESEDFLVKPALQSYKRRFFRPGRPLTAPKTRQASLGGIASRQPGGGPGHELTGPPGKTFG
jgi:hypothetical protein